MNFYFHRLFSSVNIITKMDHPDKEEEEEKKKIVNLKYILSRDSDLDPSTLESLVGGTVEGTVGGGSGEGGESYGALMRILAKDRSPAIMIHEFDVQRIADAPCYVIVSQLTTRIP